MKKKILLTIVTSLILVTAAAAVMTAGRWVRVEDSCGKCVMNDRDRECGKCGGFMQSYGKSTYAGDGYIKSSYKCKKCGHTVIYKNK